MLHRAPTVSTGSSAQEKKKYIYISISSFVSNFKTHRRRHRNALVVITATTSSNNIFIRIYFSIVINTFLFFFFSFFFFFFFFFRIYAICYSFSSSPRIRLRGVIIVFIDLNHELYVFVLSSFPPSLSCRHRRSSR